ncbi:MAG: DUF1015 domain-containing protein [Deltaproteobacteria bacterium]|nr:DUF1015 domain-containing protein [Deltaproteobacteria bacterium]
MSEIRPFRGLRPRPDRVEKVASPPYDVLSSDEAREMARSNPQSFLHVVKAEIDLPADVDVHSEAVYAKSAENYRKLIKDGLLVQDAEPAFYVYELRMGEHVQRGLVVGASVDEYESGRIKKHEFTRRDKEDDRARHVEILRANAGPVLFTYRARAEIRELVAGICAAEPAFDFVAADGVGHRLWVADDRETVSAIRKAFEPVEALYVADGHHRTASAFRVRNILRDKNPDHKGEEAYNFFLAVLFPDDELRIMGYHRVVRDLNGLEPEAFLERVAEKFELRPDGPAEPAAARHFGMYTDGRWYELVAREGSFPKDDPVRSLDAAILQENLLAPVLGIADPRSDERIDFVGGIRGTPELERRCRCDMRVAFALHPVSVAQLMAIADAGAVMPPKSTWFEPKLRSGVVVRSLDD